MSIGRFFKEIKVVEFLVVLLVQGDKIKDFEEYRFSKKSEMKN